MAKAKEPDLILDLPVSFGTCSTGKKTCRVGVTADRSKLKIGVADKTFCDRRLTLTIFANGPGDQQGQARLDGMDESIEMVGVADVKGFGVHSQTITFGLTFNSVEIKKTCIAAKMMFADFAGREGRLMIAGVGPIPEEEKSTSSDDDDS